MFFDTHAHYDSHKFDSDRMEMLASMPEQNVSLIVNPGCDEISSQTAIRLAEAFSFVYAAVGWHPSDLIDGGWNEQSLDNLRQLAKHPKVVAIGEIGLDYYWDKTYIDLQHKALRAQMDLALELNLPVIIHDREAHGDILSIAKEYDIPGVFHCYSGSPEMAKELLKRGWYLGFDGPVTYKNNRKQLEVLEVTPLDRILIETDSPYLTPEPFRGKRNDSAKLQYVAAKIGEVKGISMEEAAAITMENGRRLFGI